MNFFIDPPQRMTLIELKIIPCHRDLYFKGLSASFYFQKVKLFTHLFE